MSNVGNGSNSGSTSGGGTRVWVRRAAIEALTKPKQKFHQQRGTGSGNHSHGLSSSMTLKKHGFSSNSSDTESDAGTVVSSLVSNASSLSPGHSHSHNHQQHQQQWGWCSGYMNSTRRGITVQFDEDSLDASGSSLSSVSSSTGTASLEFPSTAMADGTIVVDNEYRKDGQGNTVCPDNLISLTHLHEPAVVFCLHNRYHRDLIYTSTGPVLLALNPFKNMRQIYGKQAMKNYWDRAERKTNEALPPHVFGIADAAFRSMMRQIDESVGKPDCKANQSILVSGESGAGKTVTTKFVLKYLAALSQRSATTQAPAKRAYLQVKERKSLKSPERKLPSQPSWALQSPTSAGNRNNDSLQFSSNSIESKVLQSNPILESFGNARTIRNDNSSRFGKFIEIQFTETGKLIGANIETYLLEKVRLITQSGGERNYHVFFEMLSGMEPSELRQYYLAKTATPDDFFLTRSGTYDRRDGVSDVETYKALRAAMNTMKLSPTEQKSIFSVTAAILHASNLQLLELENDQSSLDGSNIHLGPVCQLLGVTPEDLNQALCTFSIQAGREGTVRRSLSQKKAEKAMQALLKAMYGALFQYLVKRINDSIAFCREDDDDNDDNKNGHGDNEDGSNNHNGNGTTAAFSSARKLVATIGVLDIFGFESFTVNSFEQLCINYCNEALQQQFNAFVLKDEQDEYEREGIEWSFIEFPENQDVLDLIDKRGAGILNILDDQCRAPGTTDRSFAADVYSKAKAHPRFAASRKQVASLQFHVEHYAGLVEYTADRFVEKNRDELPKEASELLQNSTNPFVQFMSDILASQTNTSKPDSTGKMAPYSLRRVDSSAVSRITVGGQFRRQLRDLRAKIDKTSPHYIRCLKPNNHLVPDLFDPAIIAEQLKCGGILEAVRVSRSGFSHHYLHIDFLRRYRCLAVKELDHSAAGRLSSSSATSTSSSTSSSFQPSSFSTWTPVKATPVRKWGNVTKAPNTVGGAFPRSHHSQQQQQSQRDPKDDCKKLLKALVRRVQRYEAEDKTAENGDAVLSSSSSSAHPGENPIQRTESSAKAKTYNKLQNPSSTPSWARRGRGGAVTPAASSSLSSSSTSSFVPNTPGADFRSRSHQMTPMSSSSLPMNQLKAPSATSTSRGFVPRTPTSSHQSRFGGNNNNGTSHSMNGRRSQGSTADCMKLGIQMGKTKVFMRHRVFEVLERIRSQEVNSVATKLNSVFRMYLSRVAYIPVRDAYRQELRDRGLVDDEDDGPDEMKFDSPGYRSPPRRGHRNMKPRKKQANAASLIAIYDSFVRDSIHNPTARHEWGKTTQKQKLFKWVLADGIWTRNPQPQGAGSP